MSPEIGGAVTGLLIGAVVGGAGHLLAAGRPGIGRWQVPLIGVVGGFLGTVLASAVGVPLAEPVHAGRIVLQTLCSSLGVAAAVMIGRRSSDDREPG